ncbi:MAG: hypothetical protein IKX67_00850 [Bacteroidales bacterium]|nr:hypothetical protein [Bacteroidales bacterium]
MKKHLTLILVVLLASTMSITINAKNDDPEGEPIPIELNDPGESGNPIIRGPIVVPVAASFNRTLSHVNVQFLSYIGEVAIQLTNLYNNASVNMAIDSNFGSCIIPVTNGVGLYQINLVIVGASYTGYFIVY